ncbi:MAG: hypothetical protein N2511_00065 [Thermodesulfovibrionales bacterium]|nr:hypothetical protein [Thermodesulfovibrionales bacterium]
MLIELIIVLVLIVLMLGLSTIFFANSLPSNKFNATVREIAAHMKYARTIAKLKGENQAFFIDLDLRQYGVEGLKSRELPQNINIKVFDPIVGEIFRGRYQMVVQSSGGVDGGTIFVFDGKRTATISLDPIVGTIILK